jgi:iron complex outermembrane receptor protein
MYSTRETAAVVLLGVLLSSTVAADAGSPADPAEIEEQPIEEITVSGRQLSSRDATIIVEQEFVVDVAEALSRLPGADRNQNGRLSGIAQYRGMFGDRVSVSIDGLGMISGGPNSMDPPLSYVSPMITEQLTLERGIPGVASAPESIGGHVDAAIARGNFTSGEQFDLGGMAGARYANNGDTTSLAGRLTAANRSHRVSLVGQSDRGDDQSTPAGRIVPSQLSRDRIDASYAYRGEGSEFQVFAGLLDTGDTGTPALAMDIRYIDSKLYGASLARQLSPVLGVQAKVGYNDVDHVMDNFSLRPAPGSPMQYRQNRAGGDGFVFALQADYSMGDFLLAAGVDGRLASHDSLITNPDNAMFFIHNFNDIERDVMSAFFAVAREAADSEWEVGLRYVDVATDAGTVSFGGLMDMMGMNAGQLADAFNAADRDLSFGNAEAVIKYSKQLSSELAFNVDIGSKARAPSYQELYLWLPLQATGGLADGRNYVGNLGLSSERSNEIVAGIDWSGERFAISPQAYFRDVRDYIQGVPATVMPANMLATMMSGNGALQFDNVDAEIYGFDLGWRYSITERFGIEGSASYTRGRRTDVDDNLYRLPPLNGSVALSFVESGWSMRAELVAYDRQDHVSAYNDEQPTPGYGVVNAAFSWTASPAIRIDVEASNLFDRGYQDHLAGVNRVNDVDIPPGERLWGAERTLGVGAVFRF